MTDTPIDEQSIPPTIGVLTALPKEYAAVETMLDNAQEHFSESGTRYLQGTCPSASAVAHPLVVGLLDDMGNNQAALAANNMLRDFPTISEVLFVGIAGAVPNVEDVERHVRLGDIVTSGREGVIQYDIGKQKEGKIQRRPAPRAPSARFARAVRQLDADLLLGKPLGLELARAKKLQGWARPEAEDKLRATPPSEEWLTHPSDPRRREDEPRVFSGAILSGNMVLKDAKQRDELRDECGG